MIKLVWMKPEKSVWFRQLIKTIDFVSLGWAQLPGSGQQPNKPKALCYVSKRNKGYNMQGEASN